jgi:hypothetical protein
MKETEAMKIKSMQIRALVKNQSKIHRVGSEGWRWRII